VHLQKSLQAVLQGIWSCARLRILIYRGRSEKGQEISERWDCIVRKGGRERGRERERERANLVKIYPRYLSRSLMVLLIIQRMVFFLQLNVEIECVN